MRRDLSDLLAKVKIVPKTLSLLLVGSLGSFLLGSAGTWLDRRRPGTVGGFALGGLALGRFHRGRLPRNGLSLLRDGHGLDRFGLSRLDDGRGRLRRLRPGDFDRRGRIFPLFPGLPNAGGRNRWGWRRSFSVF
jgi:hypothetical protein